MISRIFFFLWAHFFFIVFVLILPIIIINGFTFNDETFTFNFSDMLLLSGVFDFNKVKTYLSVIPAITLTIAYLTWYNNRNYQRIADINGLLEEIRHNINSCDAYCQITDKARFYEAVYDNLKKLNRYGEYPVDTNSQNYLLPFVQRTTYSKPIAYIKLRYDFITSAISSKSYFHLNHHRIFLNLGHLNFSILRHNLNIENHNENLTVETFENLQDEYFYWLHCRLHFMLVDLVTSANEREIIDKNFIKTMISYFKIS